MTAPTICGCAEPLPLTDRMTAWLVPRHHDPLCLEVDALDADLADRLEDPRA